MGHTKILEGCVVLAQRFSKAALAEKFKAGVNALKWRFAFKKRFRFQSILDAIAGPAGIHVMDY